MPKANRLVRSKKPSRNLKSTKVVNLKSKAVRMPTADQYSDVLSSLADAVWDCANTGHGAAILIRPAKRGKRWSIQTAALCFLKHPDTEFIEELKSLLADRAEWEHSTATTGRRVQNN